METRFFSPIRFVGFVGVAGVLLSPGKAGAQPQSSLAGTATASIIANLNQETTMGARLGLGKPRLVTRPDSTTRLQPDGKVAGKTSIVKTTAAPSSLPARHTAVPNTTVSSTPDGERERILLAELDADLKRTEQRLDSTSEKLSDGQKELMALSNTLRAVMDEIGEDAAGLHPFVRVASRYAGTPYVWGGESRYGFDCSGFIIRVMRDLGYKALPHSAAEQFKYGTPIAQSLLKPGDIVFFANTYKPGISHVGIYIGKRRFIHAASTRQGTIVSSLDASPYKQKYAGARRLIVVRKNA